MALSVISLPSIKLSIEFFKCFCRRLYTSEEIATSFSRVMALIVAESLQDTLGRIGVPRNSPTKASTCFLIRGMNSTDVG